MEPAKDDPLPPLREVIARYELGARKSLGQHFLLDLNLTRRIARAAGPLDTHTIIEVGPGPGGLTRGLLMEGAVHVLAIERDARCLEALSEIAAAFPGRLTVVEGDALRADEPRLLEKHALSGPAKIVANLPYNVGTPLLVRWLTQACWPPWYDSLTVMLQKEVVERFVAAPGSKLYGRLSVLGQWRCDAALLFDVSPRAFTPPPQVTSAILHLTPAEPAISCPVKTLERVTAAAFGQRRKMLRSSLKQLGVKTEDMLARAGIPPTRRAEEVDVAGFCRLAQILG